MHASNGFVASWPHVMVQDAARTLLRLLARKGGRTKEDKKSPSLPTEPAPSKKAFWRSHTSPAMSNFPELTCMIAPSYKETGKCNFYLGGNIPSLGCSKLGQLGEEWEGGLVLSMKKKAETLTLSNIWVYYLITAELVWGWRGRNVPGNAEIPSSSTMPGTELMTSIFISHTSDMQMTPPLWQKAKRN